MKIRRAIGFVALAGAILLGGCSYRPLYGSTTENAGVAATLSSVAIPEPTTRLGQIIRNDLISTMRPGNAGTGDRYTLNLTSEVNKSSIIQNTLPAASRQSINVSVSYDLLDQQTGQSVHRGKTFSQASYDIVREPFADMQAETDATARAAHEVSADIRTRLAAYFASQQ